ncbi:MAG: YHS domain-containing protein [Acidimicrobiales bacterium]|nr:YHS domain-containing protein [Acidimicrobiales bacterium]
MTSINAEVDADDPGAPPGGHTFSFVDLAGFTAATEVHGDSTAVGMAERLVEVATGSLGPGDQLVKSIGDAVMLVSDTPLGAVRLVGAICDALDHEPAFPVLRAGMHEGPAIARGDDWFGGAVNLAARVAAHAAGDQVLSTASVATAAAQAGFDTRPLGEVRLRNVREPVHLLEVVACPTLPDRVIDPVCHMAVDRRSATGRLRHDDHEHLFCSLECAGAFAADPGRYTVR